jgi:hypothetical protein
MSLGLSDFEEGVRAYWREIERRSAEIQVRELEFPKLAAKFAGRIPPHFVREDLELIIKWKYSFDCRLCDRALEGLRRLTDRKVVSLTRHIGVDKLEYLLPWLRGAIPGVGIAGLSSILAAARPDLYAVIDDFSLRAIYVHFGLPWIKATQRSKDGRFIAEEKTYIPYVDFCSACAREITKRAGRAWTPRDIEMALWGVGKGQTA